MTRLALLPLALAGCNHAPLSGGGDAAAPPDLTAPVEDLAGADLAWPIYDLARWCPDVQPNSSVSVGGAVLAWAGLGDRDMGNEGNCGPPPEAVALIIATDQSFTTQRVSLQFPLPLTVGQTTTQGYVDQTLTSFSVNITAFTLVGAGPSIATLSGTLSTTDGAVTGSFAAAHCSLLDEYCI
jgi:hypothetical protein